MISWKRSLILSGFGRISSSRGQGNRGTRMIGKKFPWAEQEDFMLSQDVLGVNYPSTSSWFVSDAPADEIALILRRGSRIRINLTRPCPSTGVLILALNILRVSGCCV